MFYSINILIGGIVIKRLHPYVHKEDKAEVLDRTLDESLFINRRVNSEGQLLTKYHFEISGINDNQMINIQIAAVKTGNFYLIDYYEIPEVFSGDGVIDLWTLRRPLASESYLPIIVTDGNTQTVAIKTDTSPPPGNVYVNKDTGVMKFGTPVPLKADDNIIVLYVPKYPIHIVSWVPESREAGLISYKLICEET
ncbi:hypothetical protein ES708_18453 [subsurface metagenome]